VRRQLHVLFDRLLRFSDSQQRVLTTALEISTRRSKRVRDVHERTQAGKWGLSTGADDDETIDEDLSARGRALSKQVAISYEVMRSDFRSDIVRLIELLQSTQGECF
jgi:hypothetical protein